MLYTINLSIIKKKKKKLKKARKIREKNKNIR